MIPSSEAVAENVTKHVDAMAREIAKRVAAEPSRVDGVYWNARAVMLDWLLGDWVPPPPTKEP